jgi:transcriptional regulator with XRE-family HTH domain
VWVQPRNHRIVGECLADARKAAGITQDELAALLKKPQSLISAYERGQRRIDLLEFLTVMDAIKADPQKVFGQILERAAGVVKRARRRPAR